LVPRFGLHASNRLIRRLKEKLLGGRQNLAGFTLMPTQQGFAFARECNRFVK